MGHKKRPNPKQSKNEKRKLARETPAPFSAQAKGFTPIGNVATVEIRPNLVGQLRLVILYPNIYIYIYINIYLNIFLLYLTMFYIFIFCSASIDENDEDVR